MRKIAVLLALLLAACGQSGQPAGQDSATQPSAQRPTAASAAPTVTRATRAPATAIPPAPTVEAIPTATAAPAPSPTALPPTVEVIPTVTAQPQPSPAAPAGAGFILFNRQGAIWRFDVATGAERQIAERGSHFRASPDGRWLAYALDGQLLLADRDGAIDQRSPLASDVRSAPAWAPDSSALAVTTGAQEPAGPLACSEQNQLLVIELGGATRQIGAGCQPAWAPESKRLAYVTPINGTVHEGTNALRLVNRQGANGWAPVTGPLAAGPFPYARRIFYAPFWSADGKLIYAFAFDGYHALTDVSTLEAIDATQGGARTAGLAMDVIGATARVRPDSAAVAFEIADAKGTAAFRVLDTEGPASTMDFFGTPLELSAELGPRTEFATSPAWSPDGALLAAVYCEGDGYVCPPEARAEVRLFGPDGAGQALIADVDPGSALEWHR